MREINVGDYVRTKKGIAKILGRINEPDNYYFKMLITDKYLEIHDDTEYIHDLDIIKSSKNIIDLIEVGDYVNGKKVDEISLIEDTYYIKTKVSNTNNYDYLPGHLIKTILTKEQFESMTYEVEE